MRQKIVLAVIAAAAALILWRVFQPQQGEDVAAEADAGPTIAVLRRGNGSEPEALNPHNARTDSAFNIVRDLFEGLTSHDPDGKVVPGVAESWQVSDDGLVYTFTLRDNAKWSNGDPVTAGDFVYAWRRAASPELASPYAWYIELMSIENGAEVIAGDMPATDLGVTAIDDLTFEVRLSQPLPYFPQMVTHGTTFPVHPATVEEFGSDWVLPGNMVSNGAYVLTEFVPQERLVRERNPMYWNNDATILDKVVKLVITDENVALTRYLAGELDRTDVPAGQFPSLKEQYPDQAVSVPQACSYYYMFNLRDGAAAEFQDPNVRKALSLAIDRDIIVLANPEIAGLPNWVIALVAAGGIAAALSTAAGLLLLTGWDRRSPLVDPMCGTGTIAIEAALAVNLKPHDDLVREVAAHILFSGGKRLRPLLLLLVTRMCGYRGDYATTFSISFEYLHAATLLHDDLIDEAELRRIAGTGLALKQAEHVASDPVDRRALPACLGDVGQHA